MAEDDKTKFWVFLIGALLAVSVLVLLLDMGIKSAILEESNALKRTMNEVKWNGAGPGPDKADSNGASDHGSDDASNDGIMYLYSLPEWKRRLFGRVVRERLVPDQWPEQSNIVNEMEMADWRRTVSRWIHDRTWDDSTQP